MGKQYKVIKISSNWSLEKLKKKVEDALNKISTEGWEIISVSFTNYGYTAMITIAK
ncbi:DUF4177 domain-containing protein [uncultured Aquimarina sp.]|uniref:DUF4177 domain-containing protein n=1 Tax=uncultured Aquimarina sp. TaxID=575652 RepID=UPI00261601C1|nr:DUF4177 domain-containing protein [uncultured Aquimarina sp.]